MAVVVDASAIAAMAFNEPEGATVAAHLAGETLLAPSLIDYELANTAVKKAAKRPDEQAAIAAGLLVALNLRLARIQVPTHEAFTLAIATGLSAYDASYLWLARSRDAELVTLDRTLARTAAAMLER
jgi:predicted nucleic acid-binding protein